MNQFQLVCILSIIAIAYAGGDAKDKEKKDAKFIEDCQKETNASDDDVEEFEEYEFPKTKTQACLVTCYYKKTGVIKDDNTINMDKALEELAEVEKEDKETHGKLKEILKDCNTKYTPTKECDSIKVYTDCIQKSAKEAGIPLDE
ncbi:Odorant-binding protein 19d [Carabus blaptoides fortunei]